MKSRRLGRGLDFLLQGSRAVESAETTTTPQPSDVGIDEITSNPWQPRTQFSEDALVELTASIKAHGIIQPIVVRPKPAGGYELIAGERRLIAAKRAGLSRVPIVIRPLQDDQMLVVALIENIQRRDLNPVERSRAFRRLVDEHHLSHDQIGELAGLGRSTVSNSLRILELSAPIIEAIEAEKISEGHARALLAETDPRRREELFRAILDQRWNVRKAETAAARKPSERTGTSPDAASLAVKLSEKLGTSVSIVERGKRGRIVIGYSTLPEFERIYERLCGEPLPSE